MTAESSSRLDWSRLSAAERVTLVLAAGFSCALATGYAHAAIMFITRHMFHQLVWVSREFVWMAPITYSLVFLPGIVLLALAAALIRHRAMYAIAVGCCVAVGAVGLLLPYTEIARSATLIFSVGLAVAVARGAARSPTLWKKQWRTIAVSGAVLVPVFAFGTPLVRRAGESRALASLPASTPGAPNVLLIILDTVRAASMSLYGAAEETTPHLAQWARSATTFDWAYSTAPWTLPSHASMFTGRYAGETTADWKTPLDRSDSTLAEIFDRRGYETVGIVGNIQYTSYDSGLDRGFLHYEDYPVTWRQLINSSSYTQTPLFASLRAAHSFADVVQALRQHNLSIDIKHRFDPKHASAVAGRFLDWEQRVEHGRPFFAFLNFMDAHQGYYAPPAYHRFGKGPWRPGYLAAISYLDAEVDSILSTLQARGVLDNTLVIVAADHGELLGEHKLYGHAHDVYNNVLHVPLVIRFPGHVPAGVRVERTVSLRDLAATVVDLANAHALTVQGRSLASRWTGDTVATSVALSEVSFAPNVNPIYPTAHGPLASLVDDSLHYIRDRRGAEELYAYRSDTLETADLALQPDSAVRLAAWRTELRQILGARANHVFAPGPR